MKRWLLRFAVISISAILLVLIGAWMFLETILKLGVEKVGPQITKSTVTVQSVGASVIGGKVSMDKLIVGSPDGGKDMLKLNHISVQAKPLSFLSDVIVIPEIVVDGADIYYKMQIKSSDADDLLQKGMALSSQKGSNLDEMHKQLKNPVQTGEALSKPSVAVLNKTQTKKVIIEKLLLTNVKFTAAIKGISGEHTVAVPDIILTNIGVKETPLTIHEALLQIYEQVIHKAITAGNEGGLDVKGLSNFSDDQIKKATDTIKNNVGETTKELENAAKEKLGNIGNILNR